MGLLICICSLLSTFGGNTECMAVTVGFLPEANADRISKSSRPLELVAGLLVVRFQCCGPSSDKGNTPSTAKTVDRAHDSGDAWTGRHGTWEMSDAEMPPRPGAFASAAEGSRQKKARRP